MEPPKVWVMLEGDKWREAPLTKAQDVYDLKQEIKRLLAPKILTGRELNNFNRLKNDFAMRNIYKDDYNERVDLLCEDVDISLKAVDFKTVLRNNPYNEKKHIGLLEEAAQPLTPQNSLHDVLRTFDINVVIRAANNDTYNNDIREGFAENIWVFAYLPQGDGRPLKRPRIEDDEYKSIILRILNWMFTKRPKLLPPVPKPQTIVTNGNVTIYAGIGVPVGEDEFQKIVYRGFSFVDKTLLISDFLESSAAVSHIVRPRRFGKTTNLSMLRNFFAVPFEPDSKERREELFKGSKIWREKKELFKAHFCMYPVIYINLKDFQACSTWERMEKKLREMLAGLYEEHIYLLDSISTREKELFELTCRGLRPAMRRSLKELSEYLRIYYRRECIVLIDEYDHPLDVASHNGFYDEARDFFSSLFGGLLESNGLNVYKALLVGVTRISMSDLNNVTVYPMFDTLFSDKFGFTVEEVTALLQHHQKIEHLEGVKSWYDGYRTSRNVSLYNPWSVISFIEHGTLKGHWVDTGATDIIQELIWCSKKTFKKDAMKLIRGELIEVVVANNLRYQDISRRYDKALWALLYYAGYLSHEDGDNGDDGDDGEYSPAAATYIRNQHNCSTSTVMKLRIPNKEVMSEWVNWLQLPGAPLLDRIVTSLLNGKLRKFYQLLSETILENLSYHDVGGSNSGEESELFYHGYLMGWLAHARFTGCDVKSNKESGLGRHDSLIEYKQDRKAAILEYKVKEKDKKDKKTIKEKAEEGLAQIQRKKYRSIVSEEIDQLVELGIAFQGKLVAVVGRVYKKENGTWREIERFERSPAMRDEGGEEV